MTRILIPDDCDVVRFGIRRTLEAHPDLEVVAEAADGKEAILKAIASKPDVAIVEYCLPMMDGAEVHFTFAGGRQGPKFSFSQGMRTRPSL
jgi:DNA-binding NarL/FixJ family response regulator